MQVALCSMRVSNENRKNPVKDEDDPSDPLLMSIKVRVESILRAPNGQKMLARDLK